MKNARIAVVMYNYDRSEMFDVVHYAERNDMTEKDMKKWYNHICKEVINKSNADVADVFALYEDNVNETVHISEWWAYNEMKHDPMCPF